MLLPYLQTAMTPTSRLARSAVRHRADDDTAHSCAAPAASNAARLHARASRPLRRARLRVAVRSSIAQRCLESEDRQGRSAMLASCTACGIVLDTFLLRPSSLSDGVIACPRPSTCRCLLIASTAVRRSGRELSCPQAVKASPLVVFMKGATLTLLLRRSLAPGTPQLPQCGFSRAVIQVLEMSGVAPDRLKTYNCLDDEELRRDIKEYSYVSTERRFFCDARLARPSLATACSSLTYTSDWPTIPQVYVDGEFLGGCDIMLQQYKDGSLAQVRWSSALHFASRLHALSISSPVADLTPPAPGGQGRRLGRGAEVDAALWLHCVKV